MRNRKLLLLTAVVGICFAGLMAVQVIWINKVIEANTINFRSKVSSALKEAAANFRKNSNHKENISYAVNINQTNTLSSIKNDVSQNIKSSFQNTKLDLEFQLAIYAHQDDEEGMLVYKFGDLSLYHKLPVCNISFNAASNSYQVPLTCSTVPDNPFHLGVILPQQQKYLFSTLMASLWASIIFTAALIGLFIYFLYMVHSQKKLAQIKDDFINNLTHEFKTPIFSIGLATRLLKRNEYFRNRSDLLKYTSLIENEKLRLENHVTRILQMAMVDSGNFVLNKNNIDLHALIDSAVQDFNLALEDKNSSVALHFSATDFIINADEFHIKNVIFNLLDNAVKYNNNPPIIEIKTINAIDNKSIVITVTDNGIGMEKEVSKNIFSKFYRGTAGDVHNVKGFGLGMSYVNSIVKAHNGQITVESSLGTGTTFKITLPY